MERISIQDLAAILTPRSGLKKKEAEQLATAMFDIIKEGLAADRQVKIKGLGTFKIIDIESRESIDVTSGQRMLIEGHEKITFTPDTTMKELVNKPFSQFETVALNEGVDFDDASAYEALRQPLEDEDDNDEVDTDDMLPLESVAEPEQEDTPAPIVKPEPEETPVPAVELEPEETLVPAVEPELALKTTLVAGTEAQPAEEPQKETAVEETAAEETAVEETAAEENSVEETDAEESPIARRSLWLMLAAVACIVAFTAGYLMGMNHAKANSQSVEAPVAEATHQEAATTATQEPAAEPKTAAASAAEQPIPQPEAKEQPKSESKEQTSPAQLPKAEERNAASGDKYEQMDVRVRTGAYRIVGTAEVVTVKAGETLKRISKAYLGDGMECYVEVYNGLDASSELKAGQKLKIPKLELKKKSKK